MRGAVDEVASMLEVSRTAIYNYLTEANTKGAKGPIEHPLALAGIQARLARRKKK